MAAKFPFNELLGVERVAASPGAATLRLAVEERHLRSGGIVHGGVFASLVDVTLGVTASTTTPPEADLVTIQLNVNFVKATRAGEVLTSTGEVLHRGRRTIVASARVVNQDGVLVTTGIGTLMIVDRLA